MAEFDGTTAITGHTFMPTVAACAPCHGAISDFSDILALDDFDGDGTIEGVQLEVAGLMEILEEDIWNSMIARGVDTTGLDLEHAIGDTSVSSFVERGAGFNLIYLIEDGSHGIHNPDYVVQLLQQSIQYLTGAPVPNAVIVREEENAVTAKW